MRSWWNIQAFNVVESSELLILLSPLQLAVIVCRLPLSESVELNHFPNHLFGLLAVGDLLGLNKQL